MKSTSAATINLVVETQIVRDGRKLGRVKVDADGYAEIPFGVLGGLSRNKTFYDVDSFVDNLTKGQSLFSKLITDGNLHGEYGHPDVIGMTRTDAISRMCRIDEKNSSHHIKKVRTGEQLPTGGKLLLGTIRPDGGIHKEAMLDRLNNPHDNLSFSLRAITADRQMNDGTLYRTMQNLITFDCVTAGGYAEASKRYAATENIVVLNDLRRNDFLCPNGDIAVENFTICDVDEMFGAFAIEVNRVKIGLYTPGETSFVDDTGSRRSFFHALTK